MSLRIVLPIMAVSFSLGLSPDLATADDWTQFRGSNSQGRGDQQPTVPSEFGPDKNVLWRCPITRGLSSPCVVGDRIFLTEFDTKQSQLKVVCIGRSDGSIIWRKVVAAKQLEKVHKVSSPANATAVANERHVFFYFASCGLFCFDHDGNQVWHHPMPCSKRFNGSGTSPVLAGDILILNREDDRESYLLALNAGTGDLIWKTPHPSSGGHGEATPVIWNEQIVLHRKYEVAAYTLADGYRDWSVPLRTTAASTPVIVDDVLYVAAWNNFGEAAHLGKLPSFARIVKKSDKDGDGELSYSEMPWGPALAQRPELAGRKLGANMPVKMMFSLADTNRNGKISESEWQGIPAATEKLINSSQHGMTAVKLKQTDDDVEPSVIWTLNKSVPEVPSPLVVGPHVYTVKNGGILTCIDKATGDVTYRRRLNTAGPYLASPIVVNGFIITASTDGIVTTFQTGAEFEHLSSVDMKESISATPAVAGGVLYIRTDKALYAFKQH